MTSFRVTEDDPSRPWTVEGVYQIADDVYRVPLPMPNDQLKAVNVYVIADAETVTLIDSGVATSEARQVLEHALEALDHSVHDVTRILVTHIHLDHYSHALAMRRDFGIPVSLGSEERRSLKTILDRSVQPFVRQVELLRRYDADDVAIGLSAVTAHDIADPVAELPDVWLADDQTVDLPDRALRVQHTPGHTHGHLVFLDAERSALFAGDHVLPHITPSVGFEPEPPALPLVDYLRSLERTRRQPDTALLPAHGPPSPSVHTRVDEILHHHHRRLETARRAVEGGATTGREVARLLDWTHRERALDDLDPFNQMLAILEAGAHLDLLVATGDLFVEKSAVFRYGIHPSGEMKGQANNP
jgi:glyoxylase-like metal-dependent hydrolase (beta-lactamase superfamily II)